MPFAYIEACERQAWHLCTWSKAKPGQETRSIYRCRSWRHAGPCREWCGRCDFARCQAGLESRDHWLYMVLTYCTAEFRTQAQCFRFGLLSWSKLRKRLTRRFGHIDYIQTWEVHKTGWPHVNVVLSNERMFAEYKRDGRGLKRRWLEPALEECGFGAISWLDAIRSKGEMAGYITKLAGELTGAGKKSQVPTNAPRHFRRIRASHGLLPLRYKDPDITGKIVKTALPGLEALTYKSKLA